MINLTGSIFIILKILLIIFKKIHQLNIIKITKKDYGKKIGKDIKVFLNEKSKKSNNMVLNDTKIYQKMKNKSVLSIETNIINREKMSYYNYKEQLF